MPAVAGLPIDATLIGPLNDDPSEHPVPLPVASPLAKSIQPDSPLTLAEAYRNYRRSDRRMDRKHAGSV